MTAMRFGLVLPVQAKDTPLDAFWEELINEVRTAEAAGFDAVFLPEFHQARGGALVSPMTMGAAILQATTRIRFGQAVLALPLHHPVRLAEDLLMLDWMSGGRAFLGVGVGHQVPDFAAYGVPHGDRVGIFEEQLDIIEQCLSGEPFRHEGRFFTLDAAITPRPRTTPRPEIWIGAHSEAGLDRAARRADRWISDPQRDVGTIGRLAARYRESAAAAGRPSGVALFREAWIDDDRAACERVWGDHALALHRLYYNVGAYRPQFEPWVADVTDRADFTLERLAPGRFLYGSSDDIRATVDEWVEATGTDYLALRFRHPGGPSHRECREAIRRFGDEVIAPLAVREAVAT